MIKKIRKIAYDICIAAISVVIAGFAVVLIMAISGFFMLIEMVVGVLGFLFLCLLGGFTGAFALFEYLSGRSKNQDNKKVKKTY